MDERIRTFRAFEQCFEVLLVLFPVFSIVELVFFFPVLNISTPGHERVAPKKDKRIRGSVSVVSLMYIFKQFYQGPNCLVLQAAPIVVHGTS